MLDLNCAVVNYVRNVIEENGIDKKSVLEQLKGILEVDDDDLITRDDEQLLKRKWNSIVRLQRTITQLENKCAELQSNVNSVTAKLEKLELSSKSPITVNATDINWVPFGSLLTNIKVDSSVTAVRLHPTLSYVYIGTDSGKLYCYDILDFSMPIATTQAHAKSVTSIDVVEVDGFDQHTETSTIIATTSKDALVNAYIFSSIRKDFVHIRSLTDHDNIVSQGIIWQKNKVAFLASCSRDLSIKVWNLNESRVLQSFVPHSEWIKSIDVFGEYILSGSLDSTLRLTHWPSTNGLSIGSGHTFPIEKVKIIPFSQDTEIKSKIRRTTDNKEYKDIGFRYCASASRDNTIKIWEIPLPFLRLNSAPVPNTSKTEFTCIMTLKGHSSWVKDIKIRGDHLFSCSDDKTVKCWNLNNGECLKSWNDMHNGFINCIDVDDITCDPHDTASLQRELIVTGSLDCRVKIFR